MFSEARGLCWFTRLRWLLPLINVVTVETCDCLQREDLRHSPSHWTPLSFKVTLYYCIVGPRALPVTWLGGSKMATSEVLLIRLGFRSVIRNTRFLWLVFSSPRRVMWFFLHFGLRCCSILTTLCRCPMSMCLSVCLSVCLLLFR